MLIITTPENIQPLLLVFTCLHQLSAWASIQYVADKTVLGAYRIGDSSWTLCYSSLVTSYLQKGKKVKIIVFEDNSGAVFYNRENDFLSSFSGHLLK